MHKNHPDRRTDGRGYHPLIGPRRRFAFDRRGFTLVEVLLALAILAMLLMGMQSAILLMSRAAPDSKNAPSLKAEGGRALDTLASDLAYATSISKATASELCLTVPDRDGDGNPDTIRYYWSGAGANLTRQFNSSTAQTIASSVQSLAFTYDTVVQTQTATTSTEGSEILLASYDTANTPKDSTVDSNHWIGACFRPSLPATATSWSVTRVKFKARQNGTAIGQSYVQVRPAVGNLPASDILAQATINESTLPVAYGWQDVSLTGASGLAPGTAAALIIQWASDSQSCQVAYLDSDAVPNANLTTTANAGSSWSAGNGELLFYAYGRVRTPDPSVSQTVIRSVRCSLTLPGSIALDATMRALNDPAVPP